MWTRFMDMHSGGGQKEKWSHIYIEAPEEEAKAIFYNRFGHNPERVTCTCCGDDYSIDADETLEEATAFERGCRFDDVSGKYVDEPTDKRLFHDYATLADYIAKPNVLVIRADEITPEERKGDVPVQGYVWR